MQIRLAKERVKIIRWKLEGLRDKMELYFDERTEAWQESDKGIDYNAFIQNLESMIQTCEEMEGA